MISSSSELEDLIDRTVSIPTIPTILADIQAVTSSPDGSIRDAAEIVERDPAIAARILRLVNSSFYGLQNPVSAIGLACGIVGMKVITNLVVQVTVVDSFGKTDNKDGFDVDWLWDHSFKTAMAARMLALLCPNVAGMAPADAYTCGLIHDIGKMLLLQDQEDRFRESLQLSAAQQIPLAKAEAEVFGFTHANVGGLLAQRWKLAPEVQAAVAFHHSPGTNPDDWARGFLVKAANTIAHWAGTGSGGYIGDLCDSDALEALDLSAEQLLEIQDEVTQTGADLS